MKNSLSILLFVGLFLACEKKKDDKASESAANTPVAKPTLAVKINGVESGCNTCLSSYFSGGIWGLNLHIPSSSSGGDRIIINFSKPPGIGTYTLIKFGEPSFNYQNDNTYFRGKGVLKITTIDTSANRTISKLAATFSCTTDTSFGRSYLITDGEINYNVK